MLATAAAAAAGNRELGQQQQYPEGQVSACSELFMGTCVHMRPQECEQLSADQGGELCYTRCLHLLHLRLRPSGNRIQTVFLGMRHLNERGER